MRKLHPQPSGQRFSVSYLVSGEEPDARAKAEDICYEQTVEFPADLVPRGDIADAIVGRIESFERTDDGRHRAIVSFAVETAAAELTQLLNVVFGNISIKPGIKVEHLDLPRSLLESFSGPRFGQTGLRERLGVYERPLLCTALKPMGLSNAELAEQAYNFAKGGVDLVKDDHGLTNQPFTPFEERVRLCAEAVERANTETEGHSLYAPNLTARADDLFERARRAKELGAQALLICPAIVGLDAMRALADDSGLSLPILAHPSFSGSFVTCGQSGMSHRVLYGQLMRLAGADATIFPNYGGRFSFSKDECREIVAGATETMGSIAPIFPAPGGGMTTERLTEMKEVYGEDFIVLMGGGLHRRSRDLAANSAYFLEMVARGAPGNP